MSAESFATQALKNATANPTVSAEDKVVEAATVRRERIPMSSPLAKLGCPDIPGFHCHWFNDYPGRISQALRGGYEFVSAEETHINPQDLAGYGGSGNTDLGTRVSIVVGTDDGDKGLRAYLMKIRSELYQEDQTVIQDRVDNLHDAMRQGKQAAGDSAADQAQRYVSRTSMKSTYSRRA